MLIDIILADASGRPYEFSPKEERDKFDIKKYGGTGAGVYSDDGQMSIALAEHMLADAPPTQESYAEYFIEAYRRDPRAGYSKRTASALSNSSPRRMLNASVFGPKGNGSVMRCVPLGLYSDPLEVAGRAMIQSTVTHTSIHAANASIVTALASYYFYHKWHVIGSANGIIAFLNEYAGEGLVRDVIIGGKVEGEVGNDATATASYCIRAAVQILTTTKSVSEAIKTAVATGGDVDSTACITAGLITMASDVVSDVPASLYSGLENGPYGRDYVRALDRSLIDKFPRAV